MKKLIILLILTCFYCTAYATVKVTPTKANIRMEQNDIFKSSFELTNNYDGDIDVTVTVEDWNTYKGNVNLDVNSWIKATPPKFKIRRGETKLALFSIVTDSTMVGSLSAQVTFSYMVPSGGVTIQMSCPVYVDIKGTEKIDFSIEKIDFFSSQDYVEVNATIRNDGNIHVRPSGELNVFDKKNNVVYKTGIPSSVPIYSGTSRGGGKYKGRINKNTLAPGLYIAEVILSDYGVKASKKVKFRVKKDGEMIYQ